MLLNMQSSWRHSFSLELPRKPLFFSIHFDIFITSQKRLNGSFQNRLKGCWKNNNEKNVFLQPWLFYLQALISSIFATWILDESLIRISFFFFSNLYTCRWGGAENMGGSFGFLNFQDRAENRNSSSYLNF